MLMNYSSMVTGSHIYALHMAIADLMLICTLPFQIIEISRSGIHGRQATLNNDSPWIPLGAMKRGESDLEYVKYIEQLKL